MAVIGDIHGQFYDLLHILQKLSAEAPVKYLFLGDYVDRGHYSLEVMLVVLALKVANPQNVVLLRGNHETRQMASQHSFRQELVAKKGQDQQLFDAFMDLFDHLPLACVLNGKHFCVHGGLSPSILRLEDIGKLERKVEVPLRGPVCDLMWSDPVPREDGFVEEGWKDNKTRGVAYFFGVQATVQFLKANQLQSVLRAHECVFEGFKEFNWGHSAPLVSTIFSAPNYTDLYQNLASVMIVKNGKAHFTQFFSSPHPFNLHRSHGLFDFTLSILSTKLVESITHIYRRFYNEVQKEGSLTSEEIREAMVHIKHLDKLEKSAAVLNNSLLNDSSIVDDQGQVVNLSAVSPKERFFAAKLFDQSNESAFGRGLASLSSSRPEEKMQGLFKKSRSSHAEHRSRSKEGKTPKLVFNSGFFPQTSQHALRSRASQQNFSNLPNSHL